MGKPGKPTVKDGYLRVEGESPGAAGIIPLGSHRWQEWLDSNRTFIFEGRSGHFSAQCEMRRGLSYWYGYRRRGGRLFKTYLGKPDELTQERMEQASAKLAGQPPAGWTGPSTAGDLLSGPHRSPYGTAPDAEADRIGPSLLPLMKVKPPVLPDQVVQRPRLTQRIQSPVTFIYAPSGFGKSTVINQWRQTCGMPVAWVSLEADDDQPLRFWFTLGMALQAIDSGLSQAWLAQLRMASSADLSQIVVRLANEVIRAADAAGSFPRLGLVLDDYHHIHAPVLHASLQTLLEHMPPPLQLVISSRTKPPLALGQLRARGAVTELETDDLRFTLEEGIEFLSQRAPGWQLSYDEMQALIKHTEGWIAGLRLATLALARHSDQRQMMSAFTGAHSYLREYFAENLLARLASEELSFLLHTAILRHLTGSLCDAVTGRADGASMLARLWQANLFLVQLEEPGWYRYHDLFAEMLYSQLQVQYPAGIPRLHRRAAEWYRQQNAPADAVYHLLAIHAWEEAAALIEQMALRELEQSGEDSRLLRWLHQLPESVVQQHRTLLFVYIRLAVSALPQSELTRFLARIEANITRKPADELTPNEQDVLSDVRLIRHIIRTGNSLSSQLSSSGENEADWQLLNGILLFQRFNCPDVGKAATQARLVYEAAQARQNLFMILMAGGALASLAALQGHLRDSERIAYEVLQHALARRGTLPEPASIALTALGQVCYERNALAQAHRYLLRAAEVDPNPMSSNILIMIAVQRAKLESAQGKGEAALSTLRAAQELQFSRPSGTWLDQDLIAYQALLCVRQGDVEGAQQALSEVGDSAGHALSALARAEIYLHQAHFAAAESTLTHLLRQYPHGLYYDSIMGARIMLAIALLGQHQVNEARRVMAEAIRLAAPERFVRPFLDHGAQSVPLLHLILHSEALSAESHTFTEEVLRMLEQVDETQEATSREEWMALATAAAISVREQEVLRLVSAGLSNQEIADRFSVSISTVKTHLDNIYRKLGVHNRTQAAAQAQALGLM